MEGTQRLHSQGISATIWDDLDGRTTVRGRRKVKSRDGWWGLGGLGLTQNLPGFVETNETGFWNFPTANVLIYHLLNKLEITVRYPGSRGMWALVVAVRCYHRPHTTLPVSIHLFMQVWRRGGGVGLRPDKYADIVSAPHPPPMRTDGGLGQGTRPAHVSRLRAGWVLSSGWRGRVLPPFLSR